HAVCQEIDSYFSHFRTTKVESLYVGGGTPTVNRRGLLQILAHLRVRFSLDCDICVELHPAHMNDDDLVALKDAGVTLLSVGVESTSDHLLQRIGRIHDGAQALHALERARRIGFRTINADLMFALPGQNLEHWRRDVHRVLAAGVDQLSTYPMFTFPYSDRGKELGARSVERPSGKTIRSMLRFTDEACRNHGFERCAVWSWKRPQRSKFSSITRHRYVGFGPSAATMDGAHFSVNTFDVEAYASSLPDRRPVALSMAVDRRLEMAYWLYWRVYELLVPEAEFKQLFGEQESLAGRFGRLLSPVRAAGLARKTPDGYAITPAGAYWIHRLQNEYSLSYINRLWGACRRSAWPTEAVL
ncbi:MAG: radical SAM protein, partial [Acidobacteria bacterium]|nr:radical SAM protein [Acidobacteriota bacterium]